MLSKKSAVPFRGTKEQEEELLKVIEELKDEKGALMPIMQRAQAVSYTHLDVYKRQLLHSVQKTEHWKSQIFPKQWIRFLPAWKQWELSFVNRTER